MMEYSVGENKGYKWAYIPGMRAMPLNEPQDNIQNWFLTRKKRRLFIDVGANLGVFAVIQSRYYDNVIAFEACPTNYELMKKTIELNNIKNIELFKYAIYKEDYKPMTLYQYTPGELTGGITINEVPNADAYSEFEVDTRTIDSFEFEPDAIKINIEGGEYDALRGAKQTLTKFHPDAYIECHQWFEDGRLRTWGEGIGVVKEIMKNYGYGNPTTIDGLEFRLLFDRVD